jgi:hypothetical protein
VVIWNASMLQVDEIAEAMQAKMEQRPANFVELPKLPTSIAKK